VKKLRRKGDDAGLETVVGLFLIICWRSRPPPKGEYPSRPVKIVVGFGPGSAADLTARILAQRLSLTWASSFHREQTRWRKYCRS